MEIGTSYDNYSRYGVSANIESSSTADEKRPYTNVFEYTEYLSKKFDYFGKTANVHGVPTTVTVSGAFLQKCVDDPEKAAWLEDSLRAYAECTTWMSKCFSKAYSGSAVRVFQSMSVDANGNMSCISRSTNDPDGKIAKENAKKKAKEKREKAKKLIKKKLQKLEREERLDEQRVKIKAKREATYEVRATGRDVRKISRKMQRAILRNSLNSLNAGFDIKV